MNNLAPTVDTPAIHPTYVRILCMVLRQYNVDAEEILRLAGVISWADLVSSTALFSQRSVDRLVTQAMVTCKKPSLGLDLGSAFPISAHGPMGYCAVASRDLHQAMEVVSHFGSLRYGTLRFRLRSTTDGATLELIERVELGPSREFLTSTLFVTMLKLMESVAGHSLPTIAVEFPFPEPAWVAEIQRIHPGPVRFGARHLAFQLDAKSLSIPCITADARAYALAFHDCEKLLSSTAVYDLAQRVRELMQIPDSGFPALGEVAKYFSMSTSTLIRRLKQEGTSFQDLLDETRKQRAWWYLTQTTRKIEDIAERLGYKDTTNFSRTFRRWFGVAPGDARSGAPAKAP